MMKKILKNIPQLFLLFVSASIYGQTDRYGPEQKVVVAQNFPEAVRPGSDFMMEIKISKGNISGLAKFQQYIPNGMTATPLENGGADFSFESQNVKFIWTSVSQNAEITLRYRITVTPSLSGKKYLSGTFSYVENDRTKKTSLVPKEINITPDAPAIDLATTESKPVQDAERPQKTETNPPVQQVESEPELKSEPAPASASSAKPADDDEADETVPAPVETTAPALAATTTDEKKAPPDVESPVNVSAPVASGIVFRVQIAAINEKLSRRKNYFQEKFGIQMEVSSEMHEGLKKFTVGNFTSYAQASTLKEEIQSSISDSFVVAYKDGVRIPVPEAIEMIRKK